MHPLQPGAYSVGGAGWVAVIVVGHDPVHGSERGILVLIREGEEDHVDDFSQEDPLAAASLFPVGDVGAAAPPGGDLHAREPRLGGSGSRRDGCVRRRMDLARWARATARRMTESRGFVLEPRCFALEPPMG